MATLKYYDTVSSEWKTLLVGAKGEQGETGPAGADSTVPGPGATPGGTTGQVLIKASATDYDAEWVDVASAIPNNTITDNKLAIPSGRYLAVVPISTSSGVSSNERGDLITTTSSSAITIKINAGLVAGDRIDLMQEGTGQITFAAGSGVTLNSNDARFKSGGRYSAVTAIAIANDDIRLVGDLVV
jgi:hypothetical protein